MKINLLPGERIDDLEIKGYKIIQHKEKFCFGIDAVLLSYFANVKKNEKVLDLGTGTGIIPILLVAKTEAGHISAVEIQKESADMAKRSVLLNELSEKIEIIEGDIKEISSIVGRESFNVVTSNPPYMNKGNGLVNPKESKAIARHEILCDLEDVVKQASYVLKLKGRFFMVHRPERLVEIIETLKKYNLEPKRMQLVYPFKEKCANMVLIEAIKGGNPQMTVEKPLIVYEKDGEYTQTILDIYGK